MAKKAPEEIYFFNHTLPIKGSDEYKDGCGVFAYELKLKTGIVLVVEFNCAPTDNPVIIKVYLTGNKLSSDLDDTYRYLTDEIECKTWGQAIKKSEKVVEKQYDLLALVCL